MYTWSYDTQNFKAGNLGNELCTCSGSFGDLMLWGLQEIWHSVSEGRCTCVAKISTRTCSHRNSMCVWNFLCQKKTSGFSCRANLLSPYLWLWVCMCVWQFLFLLITSGFSHKELREHALAFMKKGSGRYPDLLTLLWHSWASWCLSTHLWKISPEIALERMQAIYFLGSVTGEISSVKKRCQFYLLSDITKSFIHSLCYH